MRKTRHPKWPASLAAALIAGSTSLTLAAVEIEENPQKNLYFGETHVHTAYSLDAFLGEMYAALNPGAPGHDIPQIQELIGLVDFDERRKWFIEYVVKNNRGAKPKHTAFYPGPQSAASGWKVVTDAAEEHNEPGVFTTFNAFEWSSAPGGGNLHRNIIYRGTTVPWVPMGAADITYEEDLWKWLQEEQAKGARSLAR